MKDILIFFQRNISLQLITTLHLCFTLHAINGKSYFHNFLNECRTVIIRIIRSGRIAILILLERLLLVCFSIQMFLLM
jgi:predicted metalloenzyme YecM